ncbi:MAG: DsbA family protein [Gammaproteobacteria bacterium]|nr:DsbA family protein [Gammaproteobacteria bacterium]MDD9896090.1 DsbA family protein [Gammaproteobacteria bacterium]MDD9957488.1 DsbA family protein [Gammaproteobacteria bacterium]
MAELIDVYYSFRSPYSYLATPGMLRLEQDFDVEVALRPVLPLAVRRPDFFSPENLKRAKYIRMDWLRRAEFLGMAGVWPNPDPIVQDMETYEIAEEQPYIYELTKLGVEAERQGKGIEFAKAVSHLIFGGTKGWNEGSHLADTIGELGLNLEQMRAAISDGDHLNEVEQNQDALEASGHWGVPSFVYKDEVFFGQDRIDTLRWRLAQNGLEK